MPANSLDDVSEEDDGNQEEAVAEKASGDEDASGEARGGSDGSDDGDDAADSSDEEEEEGDNEYDLTDKFIAGEDEDEDGNRYASDADMETGSGDRKRRHKRRRERIPELDEEDYQLLEDNQVTGVRRKQQAVRKRIRKQQANQNKTDEQRLQEELFGADEGGTLEEDEPQDQGRAPAEEDDFGESEDEMAGFIDDDDFTRRSGRRRPRGLPKSVSSHGVQEMQDIFGDVDDLLGAYAKQKAHALLAEGDDGDAAEPARDDDDDEEAAAAFEEQKEARRREEQQRRMAAAIEPELMERLMIQPEDERIRMRDAPERFQVSGEAELKDAFTDEQLQDAARWILDQLVGPMPLESADGGDSDAHPSGVRHSKAAAVLESGILEVDGKPRDGRTRKHEEYWDSSELEEALTDLSRGTRGLRRRRHEQAKASWRASKDSRQAAATAIMCTLKEMWEQHHEVPVIACFRKQMCGELLSLRQSDRPAWTTDRDVRRRRESGLPEFKAGTVQARHRKLQRWDVLWAVHDLSARWRALVRRRDKRLEVYRAALSRVEALQQGGDAAGASLDDLDAGIQSCISQAAEASSMEALDDIDTKFKLVTSGHAIDPVDNLAPGVRRPQRSTAYSVLKKAGLDSLVKAMAMPASDFGDNLDRSLKRNQPRDSRTAPLELASESIDDDDPDLDAPEKVLARARQIHVTEIVSEPHVRAFVRKQLEEHMTISTAPTQAGEGQLDAFHPYGRVKRLRRMPAAMFGGRDDYLRVDLAEKEGLITVINEVDDLESLFVQPMLVQYESSAVSAVSREWNSLRHMILREVVQRLVPQLQQEATSRLLGDARAAVLEEYADGLWKYAALPPVKTRSEDGEVMSRRRIAACCWGEGRPATCMVMLDDHGSLVDVIYLAGFSGLQRSLRPGVEYDIARDTKKSGDVVRVVDFCRDNRPQAIFIGARNQSCKALKEDMSRIGDFILDEHAQILTSGHDTGTIEICYAEETLADLWANCSAAKEEFPDHADVVRRAVRIHRLGVAHSPDWNAKPDNVALGRLALEPLPVLAALCRSDGKEILSLNLHPLQTHVPEADRLKAAEMALMTVIAQVGADINVMASNAWQAAVLPFVAGLGPRKAQSLLQSVQAREFTLNRISLWNDIWKPGNAVFRNCGGFLKVTAKARGLENAEVEAIDSLRIEPLSYKLAFEVASKAAGVAVHSREEDLANVHKAIENPHAVEAVNLEELHDSLAADSAEPAHFNQISTLVDIAMEFIEPGMEMRQGDVLEAAQSKEAQFWWVSGETAETLKPGRRVEALVRFVGQNEARCVLPEVGDVEAVLSASDISSASIVAPSDYLRAGQMVAARVKTVRPEDFCVDLTTASSDLNDDARWEEKYCRDKNQFYHVLTLDERKAIEADKRRQARSKVLTKRTIDHPNFKNLSINDTVKRLEGADIGEAIFRPSLKGVDVICLTIKLHSGPEGDLIVHKDVREGRKRGGQLTLGTPLTMLTDGNKTEEKFEDLDEILARFAEPLAEAAQKLTGHRKFRDGPWEDIKESLRLEGKDVRGSAIYCLGIDYLHPGFFYIGSVLPTANRTPRREFFSISPNGFYFRHKMHKDLEKMLSAFKRNPMGPDRQPAQPPVVAPPPPLQAPPQQMQFQMPAAYPYPVQMPGSFGAFEPQAFDPQMR